MLMHDESRNFTHAADYALNSKNPAYGVEQTLREVLEMHSGTGFGPSMAALMEETNNMVGYECKD